MSKKVVEMEAYLSNRGKRKPYDFADYLGEPEQAYQFEDEKGDIWIWVPEEKTFYVI